MTVSMLAPAGVTSVSVPSTATPTVVQSPTGLSMPVYPPNIVYAVSAGQIQAAVADVPALVAAGCRVASLVSNAAHSTPNFGSVPITGIPNP